MTLTVLDLAAIALLFWGTLLVAWVLQERKKRITAIKSGGRLFNKGERPALFYADVVLRNGNAKFNVKPKHVPWDLFTENPVVKYRKAEAL